MYGCETWSMTEKDEVTLNIQERKRFEKDELATKQGVYRVRSKQHLRKLYGVPDLIADVERRMLQWLGYMVTMD